MEIIIDDLTSLEIHALLEEHLEDMRRTTPPESIHALDLNALRQPEITFYSGWENGELLGCGALKQLNPLDGEIKSMRTSRRHRRKGIASAMLTHILTEARRRGIHRISLETGSSEDFAAARNLYAAFGFIPCEPFADYVLDPNSVYMTLVL